jgi:hypothetical protein
MVISGGLGAAALEVDDGDTLVIADPAEAVTIEVPAVVLVKIVAGTPVAVIVEPDDAVTLVASVVVLGGVVSGTPVALEVTEAGSIDVEPFSATAGIGKIVKRLTEP